MKWSGSKRTVANELQKMFPQKYSLAYDVFFGGGNMLPYYKTRVFCSDIIRPLIGIFQSFQLSPNEILESYSRHWNELQQRGAEYYYLIRDKFNSSREPQDFFFLLRTCYNGLPRFNQSGDFNTSFHINRPGIHPNRLKKVFQVWQPYLENGLFYCSDYRDILASVKQGEFVFLDPPYLKTNGQYQPKQFDHNSLYVILDQLNRVGAYWLLTLDGDFDAYNSPMRGLFKQVRYTNKESSSFSRLKGLERHITNTVLTNYWGG